MINHKIEDEYKLIFLQKPMSVSGVNKLQSHFSLKIKK